MVHLRYQQRSLTTLSLSPRSIPHFHFPSHSLRHFHPSPIRNDVFFLSLPMLKAQLLTLTRWSLLLLPFIYRYKTWKHYPRLSLLLFQLPIFGICLTLALGLDQAPNTHRWRLLLMSEREEHLWAQTRVNECLALDGPLVLGPGERRVERVKRVCERLVKVLDDGPEHYVSSAAHAVSELRDRLRLPRPQRQGQASPSFIAQTGVLPFLPESQNPTKLLSPTEWRIYVVDLPRINAFALPTREVFVYTGIIDLLSLDTDADDNGNGLAHAQMQETLLAGVLAHEIAHVTQRHAVENAGFTNLAALAFDLLRSISFSLTISFPLVSDAAGGVINGLHEWVAERAYSRKLEMEADVVGLTFMAKAGYDPRMALDLWDAMAAVEEDAAASGRTSFADKLPFLRTHPTSAQRQKVRRPEMSSAVELMAHESRISRNTCRRLSGCTRRRLTGKGRLRCLQPRT
ncbi:hypothetical protein DACRYDRAFT_48620 [Dacryopinax primogenitus]|uniref:Peptidase M48 domain-containing protein n=1 Tax=Dacryopinax primogenitus (strain DJM 731) TaxID=1858805 RepID=M5G7S0_DACPD|nr:uncharacterized protein DACRYDRAFT_48620 [Dacryopinax primogenitus]EJU04180.1 hypothetical protein DACRYDRAFT_48620 [Dacryopinax primogenitus]